MVAAAAGPPAAQPPVGDRSRLPVLLPVLVLSILTLAGVTYGCVRRRRPGAGAAGRRADRGARRPLVPVGGPSVSLRDVTVVEAVRGWLDPDVDVVKARKVIGGPPTSENRRQLEVKLERDMAFSRDVAVDVAFSRLGIPVPELGKPAQPGVPPFEVTVDTGRTGGSSGGLALTLGVLDALTAGDLPGGHRVAVSGSIFVTGHVGDVDGIAQKAAAARSAGATHLLVAPRNYDEALTRAGDRLTVLQAATVRGGHRPPGRRPPEPSRDAPG